MAQKVLILTDGKAGHENQSKAFVRALGAGFDRLEVHFASRFAKALSYALDRLGICTCALLRTADGRPLSAALPSGPYAAVVGTGSGTFYAAKAAARRLGTKAAAVLYPRGYVLGGFACILAPAFDRPARAPNVVEIPANLVSADAAFYAEGSAAFAAHYAQATGRPLADGPAEAVIIGGPNRCSQMTPGWMRAQLDRIFAGDASVRRWVTTSRRTPPEVEAVVDGYPWDYRLLYSRERFNPIPGFVVRASRLYVTAESTGMLSEACTSGTAEVVALDNLRPGPHKFRRFVEGLAQAGYLNGRRKVDLSAAFARARALLGVG